MPRLVPRIGPFGAALALYETWLRLPPRHRAQLTGIAVVHGRRLAIRHGQRIAVKHGPRVAAAIVRRGLRAKP